MLFIAYGANRPQHPGANSRSFLRLWDSHILDYVLRLDGSDYQDRNMSIGQFVAVQDQLAAFFAPMLGLWVVAFIAGGVLLSILIVWMTTIRDKI